MNKWKYILSLFGLLVLMLLITNSIILSAITFLVSLFYITYIIKKEKKEPKQQNKELKLFYELLLMQYKTNKKISFRDVCDNENLNFYSDYLLGQIEDEKILLDNLKTNFNNQGFDNYVDLYKSNASKNIIVLYLQNEISKLDELSNIITINNKSNKKNLIVFYISLAIMALSRVLFNEYYLTYVTSIGGFISIICVTLFTCLYFQKISYESIKGEING